MVGPVVIEMQDVSVISGQLQSYQDTFFIGPEFRHSTTLQKLLKI